MKSKILLSLFLFLAVFACQQKQKNLQSSTIDPLPPVSFCAPKVVILNTEPGFDGTLVPLFGGLTENFTYPVTTDSKVAQKYFDQGLMLAYGFNHAEAARSFQEATRQDPECAMCWWGLGYVLGPNYNAGMEPEVLPMANEAIAKAKLLSHNCTPKEQALIKALSKRYPKSLEEDPKPFYQAYADAMIEVNKQFSDELDIAAMTAEALMDMHPWDLWLKDGTPQPWTPQILEIIEGILTNMPDHVQAIHLYIHATEAGPDPERAIKYANTLRKLVPGSGHLVHMPSHTYINTGHYHEGWVANERAVKIDSNYVEVCHAAGIYPLAYYPHNWHFLTACAALEGKGNRAVEASRYMAEYVVNKELINEPTFGATLQHFYSIPWYVMVKFAKWDDILAEPMPDASMKYPLSIWHYARGMAYAGKGDLTAARKELKAVKTIEADTSLKSLKIFDINNAHQLVSIAANVLEGEIAQRNGDFKTAIPKLAKAVEIEDQLAYTEPPDWFFSVRHLLGDVLMKAGEYATAEKIYREDLKNFKENGWALIGLHNALVRQGKKAEAKAVKERFDVAWQHADMPLASSVL
jgi:tetratricopeptide (TPR) repeat protein